MRLRALLHSILILTLIAATGLSQAQAPGTAASAAAPPAAGAYPSKPIRVIVPFAPGVATDILARLLAPIWSESMATSVVIENVPGAGGTIGVGRAARAAPDGYTLVMSGDAALVLTGGAFGVNPPYETLRDLAPIAQLIITPNVLVVANEVPVRTVQELVALVRSQPGRFSYGSGGIGLSTHRGGELLNSMAGLDMVHVPNPGNPWADVISGRVQVMFGNIAVALPQVKDGKVRALAVSSATRVPSAPDLPTVSESGFPGFEAIAWFALLAPAGTPPAILQRLEAETRKAMALPAIQERLKTMGAIPGAMNPAGLARVIEEETRRWAPKAAGRAPARQ